MNYELRITEWWVDKRNNLPYHLLRNPQSAIRNPQSAIRNPQSVIRNS
ncbi:hypothetical protein CLV51_103398 [Chitinophaga niastensis]|uniref:Uncharacterized protein n=1 Tax=Chitinophaga niastensis TaxID=536980 RepID=A0A2P8HJR4_CHINA|nr:hypothetical protein CLV51_103398 [Chitinophaga niastensis]